MTDDPIQLLRDELLAAAHRKTQPAARRSRRLRHPVVIGLAAIAVAAPAAAALTGSFPFDRGSTTDGSTYTVNRAVANAAAGTEHCRQTEIRNPDGSLQSRAVGCRAAGSGPSTAPVEAGFTIAEDQSIIISGSVTSDAASVTVTGVDKPIALGPIEDDRRGFSVVAPAPGATVTAFGSDGRVLGKITLPA